MKQRRKYSEEELKQIYEYSETHTNDETAAHFGIPPTSVSYLRGKYVATQKLARAKPPKKNAETMIAIPIPSHNETVTICKSCLKIFMELSK